MKKIVIVLIALLTSAGLIAQEESQPKVNFKGLSEFYFSYAQNENQDNPYGFSVRRLRLMPYGTLTDKVSWGFQFAFDKQNPGLLDAFLKYSPTKEFAVKIGQFAPPAAKTGALSDELHSVYRILCIERSMVTQNWLSNSSLYSYRAMGLQIDGKLVSDKLYYGLMLSNPVTTSLFTPGIKNHTYPVTNNGISFWGRIEFKPFTKDFGIGGFLGSSNSTTIVSSGGNTITTEFVKNSYGGHIGYNKNNVIFLTEYIGGSVEINDAKSSYNGMFAEIAYMIKTVAPVIRYDFFTPFVDSFDASGVEQYNNITIGIHFNPHKNIRIRGNYVIKGEKAADGFEEIGNNLLYFNLQYVFSSK